MHLKEYPEKNSWSHHCFKILFKKWVLLYINNPSLLIYKHTHTSHLLSKTRGVYGLGRRVFSILRNLIYRLMFNHFLKCNPHFDMSGL